MAIIGITGGIASGKSTFTRLLHSAFLSLLSPLSKDVEVYDCDAEVHNLLNGDPQTISEIAAVFGKEMIDASGSIDRKQLRHHVFQNAKNRLRLESILHPRIRAQWKSLAENHRKAKSHLLIDIPLLFETGAEKHLDFTLVVGCDEKIQRERLKTIRGLSEDLITGILKAQFPLAKKIMLASHVVWNDGSPEGLSLQATKFATSLS